MLYVYKIKKKIKGQGKMSVGMAIKADYLVTAFKPSL